MGSRFIVLDTLQSAVLAKTFEHIYLELDEEDFLKYAEMDEVFLVLIGGDLDPHIFDLIERSCKDDIHSYVTTISLQEWLDIIREEAEKLEYYEICHNCRIFMDELESILTRTDEHYSHNCKELNQC